MSRLRDLNFIKARQLGNGKSEFVPSLLGVMPVILATQEAEIRRIAVRSQPRQMVPLDPISKKPITKKGLVEWLMV
jgi:hypothetical protein